MVGDFNLILGFLGLRDCLVIDEVKEIELGRKLRIS